MRSARFYGNQDIRVDEVDEPSPGDGEVLVEVAACGICGSDVGMYLHGPMAEGDDHLPYIMGHEFGGTVVETGPDADVDIGTEVVVNPLVACEDCWCCDRALYNLCRNLTVIGAQRPGAYAERVVAPAGNVVPLPDGVTPTMAAVSEPITVAFHGLRQSPLESGDSVAVVGLGPIGLGLVQLARDAGASTVIASGHREARRELARRYGADVVIDPREADPADVARDEAGRGVDVAFEVAGTESSLNDALAVARAGGHATLLGVFEGDVEFDPMALVNSQRSVNASAAYQTGPLADRDFGAVLEKMAAGTLDAESLVTSRIDLADIVADGFEPLTDSGSGEVKVLVEP
ncbi:MAG: zinc-binding dehydrogenase [Halobacteriales archaeon]